MIMNHDSSIARDSFKKCAYFMGLIRGTNIRGWVQCNYDWLNKVEQDPYDLHREDPWPILEADFCQSFMDYMEQEKAYNELYKLKMAPRDIDRYIF